ncbi:hypothetical protein B4960_11300 [Listeria monocytogenes]|nr:hypothetical protein [Listeria monocytogenes]EAD0069549.1 hypothetical protein [Listeria monocytogenes]EAE6700058.1 hypothetical protein [Listeria monocytogenes]EAE7765902.1 hypothetical protein [Listeria monocytogenes]EAF1659673.1 hypothetical protein [Listeria monocytogenes]
MKQCYVLLDADGFITAWSSEKQEGFLKIEANEDDFNKLDFVRVENGKAKVDEQRRQQVIKEYEASTVTELDKLKMQNIELRDSILDIAIIVDSLGGELE